VHEVVRKALLLSASPLFRSLDEPTLISLAESAGTSHFRPGERLVMRGDDADAVFVLAAGRVRIDYRGGSIELGPGEIIGELSAIDGGKRGSDVTALEPTEALRIERDDFLDLLADQPALVLHVAETLAVRLAKSNAT
jgi:CRP-like cAMP-binding protein